MWLSLLLLFGGAFLLLLSVGCLSPLTRWVMLLGLFPLLGGAAFPPLLLGGAAFLHLLLTCAASLPSPLE